MDNIPKECLTTEQKGFDLVRPFLEMVSKKPLIWTVDKYDQEFLGDVIADLITIEIKTEEIWTGNLFFEIWSNYPIRQGWVYKLDECEILLYNFLDVQKCYGFPFKETVEWYMRETKRFPWRPQKKHTQKNKTRGKLIPIDILLEETNMLDMPLNGEWTKTWGELIQCL